MLWQAAQRRTRKVVKGVVGLVSAMKGFHLSQFVEGLSHIRKGLAGAAEVLAVAKSACEDVSALAESGQQFLECLNQKDRALVANEPVIQHYATQMSCSEIASSSRQSYIHDPQEGPSFERSFFGSLFINATRCLGINFWMETLVERETTNRSFGYCSW
ncbi:hypothetical protein EDD21DRAFT_181840 [Dissophora ornata]|nr:hypothetical protein EDD21DRAFT_181840 [Dissophora ornata]